MTDTCDITILKIQHTTFEPLQKCCHMCNSSGQRVWKGGLHLSLSKHNAFLVPNVSMSIAGVSVLHLVYSISSYIYIVNATNIKMVSKPVSYVKEKTQYLHITLF